MSRWTIFRMLQVIQVLIVYIMKTEGKVTLFSALKAKITTIQGHVMKLP